MKHKKILLYIYIYIYNKQTIYIYIYIYKGLCEKIHKVGYIYIYIYSRSPIFAIFRKILDNRRNSLRRSGVQKK